MGGAAKIVDCWQARTSYLSDWLLSSNSESRPRESRNTALEKETRLSPRTISFPSLNNFAVLI